MSNLIYGCNPANISRIIAYKGRRQGMHPRKMRLLIQQFPLRALWLERGWFDGYYKAHVSIFGPNGHEIKTITCRSNDHAEHIKNKAVAQLEQWLSK